MAVGGVAGEGSLPSNYNKFHGLSEAASADLQEEPSPGPRYPCVHSGKGGKN